MYITHRLSIIAISLFGLYPLVCSAGQFPIFEAKEKHPDIDLIINNPQSKDVYDTIKNKWESSQNAGDYRNNSLLNGATLSRINNQLNQVVTLLDNSHLINSKINGVQVNLGSPFYSQDTSATINTEIYGTSESKGILKVSSGNSVYQTTVKEYGALTLNKGKSYDTVLLSGGRQSIGKDSYAQNTLIDGGEQEITIGSKGAAQDTIIQNGGSQLVYSGSANNTHVGSQSYQLASGKVDNTHIYNGGYQLVYIDDQNQDKGVSNTWVYHGGTQRIKSGSASNNTIEGTQIITNLSGEWTNGQWVEDPLGGTHGDDPKSSNATINSTGIQIVGKNGTALNTEVLGGTQIVKPYGAIQDTTILNGGVSTLEYGSYSRGELNVHNGSVLLTTGSNHDWTGDLGKGAYAQKINLESNNARLLIQYNPNTTESQATVDTLTNNGHVIFNKPNTPNLEQYSQLNIKNLTGNGSFHMNTNITKNIGSFLNVTENVNGEFSVYVADSGQEINQTNEEKTYHLIHAKNSAKESFKLHNDSVDIGAYTYLLTQNTANSDDWYLTLKKGNEDQSRPEPSKPTNNALMLANAIPNIWKSELSTLRSRLGNLHQNQEQSALWGKYITNKHLINNQQIQYQQNMNGVMIGADKSISLNHAKLYLGGMFSYSQSDLDANNGDGKIKSLGAAIYSTWIHDTGYYLDSLIKVNHFNNQHHAYFNNNKTSASSNKNGFGFSIEVGKNIKKQDFFIEPYALLSAFYGQKNQYRFTNDMEVETASNKSLMGEAGITIGKKFITANNNEIQPYLRLALNHEFHKNNDMIVNKTEHFTDNMSGSMGKYGIGFNAYFAKSWAAYGEFNYAHGSKHEVPFDGHLGIRYTFK